MALPEDDLQALNNLSNARHKAEDHALRAGGTTIVRLYARLEHSRQPLAPRSLFAKRVAFNFAIALAVIFASLFAGMLGYRYFEGLSWLDSFGHSAMILGGKGPYVEPKSEGGKLFEGFYALYSGLLLIGVTGLILAPVFHRVMHLCHLPVENGGSPKPTHR